MSIDLLINTWKEFRKGLSAEAEQIPEEQYCFRATPETRSVAEILQHIVETQKILIGEACREGDASLRRQPFPAHLQEYAPEVQAITDKNGLLELLRSSMEVCEANLRACNDLPTGEMGGLDGKPNPKLKVVNFAMSHEMYHRGQLTVFERLLKLEPALTKQFAKMVAQSGN